MMRSAVKIAIVLSVSLALAAAAILWSSRPSDNVSNSVPPAIVAGVVEDIRSAPDSASADGDISYMEIRVIDAERYKDFMPEAGDILTLIRSEHTIDSYGPDPKVGDTVQVSVSYGKKEIQIDGECRTAHYAYKIDTYDHILEMGDEPHFPLGS